MSTSIRLNEETSNRLNKLSERTGRSKAFYLYQLIEYGLDKLEYEYGILQDIEDYVGNLKGVKGFKDYLFSINVQQGCTLIVHLFF